MEKLKMISDYRKSMRLTKNDKIEMAAIMLTSIVLTAILLFTAPPAYAAITSSEMENLVETILKAICFIAGALFALIGIIKFAISHANEDGPAQQKAIMMIATGAILVALGLAIPGIVQSSWFDV